MYSWGWSDSGRLGFSGTPKRGLPTKIDFFVNKEVVAIAGGSAHSVAITSKSPVKKSLINLGEGKVYAWGWGDKGRLGLYSTDSCHIPTLMKFPLLNQNSSDAHTHIIKPRAIALGGAHTLLLTGFFM